MNREQRTKLYMDFLEKEGYRPTLDSDGDVQFKSEGGTYCVIVDEKDEEYFRLVFFNFWSIDSAEELTRAVIAANRATNEIKVAKVYIRSDNKNTCAAIEMFIDPPEGFKAVFARSLSALKSGVMAFTQKMKESAN